MPSRRWNEATLIRSAVIVVILIGLVGGCAANRLYVGAPLPEKEEAILDLHDLDDVVVSGEGCGRALDGTATFKAPLRICPGKYTVKFRSPMSGHHLVQLLFSAEAGRRYSTKAEVTELVPQGKMGMEMNGVVVLVDEAGSEIARASDVSP